MKMKSWLVLGLLGAVGLPLAAQAGAQCGGEKMGCSLSSKATGSRLGGPSSRQIAPMTQEQGSASSLAAASSQGNPGIVPINSRVTTVKTYADLGAEWWQWALQAPATDNPLFDTTGEKCRVGQQGPLWFLAGTTTDSGVQVNRTCEVPFGKAIFFPVINNFYIGFLNDPPETRTAEFVRAQAEDFCDSNSIRDLSVTIDGRAVARPARFVTVAEDSPLFQAQLPTDNIFGAIPAPDPGKPDALVVPELLLSPGAHKGFYLYLRPLAPGSHTIAWTATWDCGSPPEPFSQNIRYTLNVLTGVSGEVQ